ncbi:MAG TPA: EH signature domain-containing protein [Rubrivivax sp.]|nr:EH signature domain-containing protein [Rubrivivax sp.]
MDALTRLRSRLAGVSEQPLSRPWAVDGTIDSHIKHLERHLREGSGAYVPKDLQEEAVRRFWTSKRVDNLKDARLVSFGVALPVGPQRLRVIEDRERFPALLDGVDQYLPAPKQYRRCYQGLLSGFFAYDGEAADTPKAGRENWEALRSYLGKQSRSVLDGERNPQWADSLQQHQTLLSEDPCGRYGAELLAGQHAAVDELREVLNISDSSWFMRKLYLAQVRAAVGKSDADFIGLLYRVLDLLQGNELIRDEGLALVLNRFARLKPPPLAVPLRDAAVNWWGNPWLQSNAMRWGGVMPEARVMVAEWLKLEFIEAFFTLLAEEHTGDNRRLEFWARYVNSIEDIHFALGADARENRSADFQALRKKMSGLVVPLRDNVRSNNAFIMRMGPLVVVEFSGYSNACYGYDAKRAMPFRFDMPVVLPKDSKNSLKHSARELWLAHQDGVRGFETWEERFKAELEQRFGIRPKGATSRPVVLARPAQPPAPPHQPVRPAPPAATRAANAAPAPSPQQTTRSRDTDAAWDIASWKTTNYSRKALSQFTERFGLEIEDFTPGGNLWVRTDDSHLGINEVLLKWGFEFKNARKGWWWRGR